MQLWGLERHRRSEPEGARGDGDAPRRLAVEALAMHVSVLQAQGITEPVQLLGHFLMLKMNPVTFEAFLDKAVR